MKNRTKLILIATLGICILSFMPSVVGTANVRPISDFTDTNDYVSAWADPQSNLVVLPHAYAVIPYAEVISDCIHSGLVLERDLKDGRISYTVNLHVKGAWMFVAYMGWGLILEGEMDYLFTVTVIVEGEFGGPVPNIIEVWMGLGGEYIMTHITGEGVGTFMNNDAVIALGYIPGTTAMVTVNQVGLTTPLQNPSYPGIWPVENVFIH